MGELGNRLYSFVAAKFSGFVIVAFYAIIVNHICQTHDLDYLTPLAGFCMGIILGCARILTLPEEKLHQNDFDPPLYAAFGLGLGLIL